MTVLAVLPSVPYLSEPADAPLNGSADELARFGAVLAMGAAGAGWRKCAALTGPIPV